MKSVFLLSSQALKAASRAAIVATSLVMLASCGGSPGDAGVSNVTSAALPVRTAAVATTQPVEQPAQVSRIENYAPNADVLRSGAALRTLGFGVRPRAASVVLAPPGAVALATRSAPVSAAANTAAAGTGLSGAPVQVGMARAVAQTVDVAQTARLMQWTNASGAGATTAISFTSPGAAGLRIGLLVRKLPAGAVVRGYAQGQPTAFELKADAIVAAITRNRDAGDMSDAARVYWLPVIDGPEATLEITLPAGASAADVDVAVPSVSHLTVPVGELLSTKIGEAASCEVDVSCASGTDTLSRSVARMLFTDGGRTYACTGTLMNDSTSSGTPYFLSANHCISTQTAASSLNTYWFYRSTSCNSGSLNPAYSRLAGGATLLYASGDTDTSFMRLNEPAPAGANFAGSALGAVDSTPDIVSLHNPQADLQKYARGNFTTYAVCSNPSGSTFSCTAGSAANSNYFNAQWSTGTTEGGSSGAAAFASIGGSRYVVGQLYGGDSSCTKPTGSNIFGRFDRAYNTALNRWLSPAPAANTTTRAPIYRFYNAGTGAHFFTQSTAERDSVIASLPAFAYEGVAYYAYSSAVQGTSPVYRFYNTSNGRHFYTINASERDFVQANYPQFKFEGPSWYAQAQAGGTATPVYRFYNATKDTHFYTINAAEKDAVVQNYPTYSLEGIGYYAWTTQ